MRTHEELERGALLADMLGLCSLPPSLESANSRQAHSRPALHREEGPRAPFLQRQGERQPAPSQPLLLFSFSLHHFTHTWSISTTTLILSLSCLLSIRPLVPKRIGLLDKSPTTSARTASHPFAVSVEAETDAIPGPLFEGHLLGCCLRRWVSSADCLCPQRCRTPPCLCSLLSSHLSTLYSRPLVPRTLSLSRSLSAHHHHRRSGRAPFHLNCPSRPNRARPSSRRLIATWTSSRDSNTTAPRIRQHYSTSHKVSIVLSSIVLIGCYHRALC